MHSFKDYLKEEVMPTVLSNGSIDIANESVRDEINGYLSAVATRPCITPYIALNKMRKVLAHFHIYLPKRAYMEGKHGVEVWEIHQFGHKMGMTDQGEFIKSTPCKYYLFFHYHLMGSMYFVEAKIVDNDELEKKMDMTERMFAEEADAAHRQGIAKAMSPKEPMHDEDDEGTESTKKAVEVSMRRKDKKLSADQLDEISNEVKKSYLAKTRPLSDAPTTTYGNRTSGTIDSHINRAGDRAADSGKSAAAARNKKRAIVAHTRKLVKSQLPEETLDETRMPASVIKHKQRIANMTPEEKAKKFAGKSEEQLKSMARRHGYGKDSDEYSKHVKEEEQIDELKKSTVARYEKKAGKQFDKIMDKATDPYLSNLSAAERKTANKRGAGLKMAADRLEETQIDEISSGLKDRYVKKAKIDVWSRAYDAVNPKTSKDKAKSLYNKNQKRLSFIKKVEEETISEKAPPGAKFERMVKHIKKGYSKDGLTAKEKSIAYATAWKAKKKESD